MKRTFALFPLLVSLISVSFAPKTGKLFIIPTLHGIHKTNANYTYDSIRTVIAKINPDIIAVEVRDFDLEQDSSYLANNYPFEMRIMKQWFKSKKIVGFDWLGEDIEGKRIPENYWKDLSPIKLYQKQLNADSVYLKKLAPCSAITEERLKLLKSLSLKQLLQSNDETLTNQYYDCLRENLKGSQHERIVEFHELRNQKILENITNILRSNRGRKIVVLTGDDHYIYLKSRLAFEELP